MEKICIIKDCNNSTHAKNYCSKHYNRIIRRDNAPVKNEHHCMSHTPEYKVWVRMKHRCYNPNDKRFKDYGGRGIIVCDRWLNSFTAFYEDMGKRPFPGAEIDREENDGNYTSDNCRWVTQLVNLRNRGFNKLTMKKAEKVRILSKLGKHTKKAIAIIFNISERQVYRVLNNTAWGG